jgi:tRNA-2-methylthio-N6-dimethylallyladenosine synthase
VLIDKLRRWWPGISLSTDIIVGFCGETDEEFAHTLDLLREIRFDVVHVAMYSPRPGTLSYKWEDDVPLSLKKERLHAVEAVQQSIALELNQQIVGTTQEILIEEVQQQENGMLWKGRTRGNKIVFFPAEPEAGSRKVRSHSGASLVPGEATQHGPGDLVTVQIDRASAWSLHGTMQQVAGVVR